LVYTFGVLVTFSLAATAAGTTFFSFTFLVFAVLASRLVLLRRFFFVSSRTFRRTNTLFALRQTEGNILHAISCERLKRFFGHLSRPFLTASIDIKFRDEK
jgi:hypothetical protein